MALTKKQIEALREIRRVATLETAVFSQIVPDLDANPYPTSELMVDDFIKERIKLWADTWIVGQLDELLAELAPAKTMPPKPMLDTDLRFIVHFKIQAQTVYVRAQTVQQAQEFLNKRYSAIGSEEARVTFLGYVQTQPDERIDFFLRGGSTHSYFNKDGMMFDLSGRRSVFDDIDQ